MEASVESSVRVVWPGGSENIIPQMRWVSVALTTRRIETLKSSESRFGGRRGCFNNDWTEDANNTSGVRRACVASRLRTLIGLMRRSRLQRTTTGLISFDAGEPCLVSLRAGNKRQLVEDIPLRWNRCRHHFREVVFWEIVFCANSLNLIRREWC